VFNIARLKQMQKVPFVSAILLVIVFGFVVLFFH
jgi:hypothetical protein